MDNSELREFLEHDSDFHDDLEQVDDWNGFTRWEQRFMLQHHNEMDVDAVAAELERDVNEVRLQMRILGLLD